MNRADKSLAADVDACDTASPDVPEVFDGAIRCFNILADSERGTFRSHRQGTTHLNSLRGIRAVVRLTYEENPMQYVTLGSTGLLVSRLCLGTMTLGDGRGLFNAISH
jgi:hypothetical protein